MICQIRKPVKPRSGSLREKMEEHWASEASCARQAQVLDALGSVHPELAPYRSTVEMCLVLHAELPDYTANDAILWTLILAYQQRGLDPGILELLLIALIPTIGHILRKRTKGRSIAVYDDEFMRIVERLRTVLAEFPVARRRARVAGNVSAELRHALAIVDEEEFAIRSALKENGRVTRGTDGGVSDACDLVDRLPAPSPRTSEDLEHSDASTILEEAFERGEIDAGELRLLRSTYAYGRTVESLAAEMGLSADTLKKRRKAALDRIQAGKKKRVRRGSGQASPCAHTQSREPSQGEAVSDEAKKAS